MTALEHLFGITFVDKCLAVFSLSFTAVSFLTSSYLHIFIVGIRTIQKITVIETELITYQFSKRCYLFTAKQCGDTHFDFENAELLQTVFLSYKILRSVK